MSVLLVVGYPDDKTAPMVWDLLRHAHDGRLSDLHDGAVIIRRADGTYELRTGHHGTKRGWGEMWGLLVGLIFAVPIVGWTANYAYNHVRGAVESTVNATFRNRVLDLIAPGTSGLFVIARDNPDVVLDALKPYGGEVLQTALSASEEEQLSEALNLD